MYNLKINNNYTFTTDYTVWCIHSYITALSIVCTAIYINYTYVVCTVRCIFIIKSLIYLYTSG